MTSAAAPTKRVAKKVAPAPEMIEAIVTFNGDLALPQVQIRTAAGLEPMEIASFGVRGAMRDVSSQLVEQGFRPVGRLWNTDGLDEDAVTGTIRRTYRR